MDELPAQRILLVVLENRRARPILALEDDVEDRVHAAAAGQHAPELALGNADRVRRIAVPVDDPGDQAAAAQPAGLARARVLTRRHLQLDPLTGHFGRAV